jgi:hypothetical protein
VNETWFVIEMTFAPPMVLWSVIRQNQSLFELPACPTFPLPAKPGDLSWVNVADVSCQFP